MVEDKEPAPEEPAKDKGKSRSDARSLMAFKRVVPAKKSSLVSDSDQIDQLKRKATNVGNTNRLVAFLFT
jgi:hypothetical protein